ncbi:MAG: hypothetical protein IKK94_08505 [Clostridia bacterium]|nr:hypothetical protein [Clostridia bacterium]
MHYYSIMSLETNHIDRICEDIKFQVENGICDYPLFNMTLVPEGNPPVDKASAFCEKYRLFQDKLHAMGLKCGILVQASIGHGYALAADFPFEHTINLTNGARNNIVCPYDENFREHFKKVMSRLASEHPDVIMVDDDFRLYHTSGKGCTCPLHLAQFNKRAGTSFDRTELLKALNERQDYRDIYVETLGDSLIGAAKAMRAGIDEIDPSLPGVFCGCGHNFEFAAEIAKELAGNGNPIVVRINNGNYLANHGRGFSNVFLRAANQMEFIRDKVDVILDETDTCPQNRYSTSAQMLHAHHVGTILEGARGAKHWITRLASYEPQSGKAYRKKLSENRKMYDALAEIAPKLSWRGCKIPLAPKPYFVFDNSEIYSNKINAWCTNVLERLGLPMYYSSKSGGVSFMNGNYDAKFSDEEIKSMLSCGEKAVLSSDTAQNLIARGFSSLLGVEIREWKGLPMRGEHIEGIGRCNVQPASLEIVPKDKRIRIDSMVQHTIDKANYTDLFPGVTIFDNDNGGKVAVFSGTPDCEWNYTQPFSYLCESRKKQLVRLLSEWGELPIYYPEDAEVYLKAADMPDGTLFCAFINLGLDELETIPLCCEKEVSKVEMLDSDGKKIKCDFTEDGNIINVQKSAKALEPVILFIS